MDIGFDNLWYGSLKGTDICFFSIGWEFLKGEHYAIDITLLNFRFHMCNCCDTE
jgi:hypothetical protein